MTIFAPKWLYSHLLALTHTMPRWTSNYSKGLNDQKNIRTLLALILFLLALNNPFSHSRITEEQLTSRVSGWRGQIVCMYIEWKPFSHQHELFSHRIRLYSHWETDYTRTALALSCADKRKEKTYHDYPANPSAMSQHSPRSWPYWDPSCNTVCKFTNTEERNFGFWIDNLRQWDDLFTYKSQNVYYSQESTT